MFLVETFDYREAPDQAVNEIAIAHVSFVALSRNKVKRGLVVPLV